MLAVPRALGAPVLASTTGSACPTHHQSPSTLLPLSQLQPLHPPPLPSLHHPPLPPSPPRHPHRLLLSSPNLHRLLLSPLQLQWSPQHLQHVSIVHGIFSCYFISSAACSVAAVSAKPALGNPHSSYPLSPCSCHSASTASCMLCRQITSLCFL